MAKITDILLFRYNYEFALPKVVLLLEFTIPQFCLACPVLSVIPNFCVWFLEKFVIFRLFSSFLILVQRRLLFIRILTVLVTLKFYITSNLGSTKFLFSLEKINKKGLRLRLL